MAEINDTYGLIYQNLMDAGCGPQTTQRCMQFVEEGQCAGMLPILLQHRTFLLHLIHKSQKQIDCLDHLIYCLKRQIL